MAATLKKDPALERFNVAREKMGHYFRLRPKSALACVIFIGVIPVSLTMFAYDTEGSYSFSRMFRNKPVLNPEYVPRRKDL